MSGRVLQNLRARHCALQQFVMARDVVGQPGPQKEKGPFGDERPKSREETPKEGCEAQASSNFTIIKL
jgi:hypothetical protein